MKKTWITSYPPGVPAEIDATHYSSLVDIFNLSCQKFASSTAYISMGKNLSYNRLNSLSRNFAAWLQSRGIKPGTRIALMMPNLLQYPVCLFGTLRAGCTVVNCNPLYTAHELEHQLNDSGAEVIVIVENFAATLQATLPTLTSLKTIVVTSIGDMLGLKGHVVNFVVRHVKHKVPKWSLPNPVRLNSILSGTDKLPFTPPTLGHNDIAFLQYTGGTTGVAKGAMLSHGNMVANVCQAYAWVKPYTTEGKDFIITALPLYHIFALTANCLTFLMLGARNLLILNPRDVPAFVREIGKYPFTAITGVNTLFNALLNNEDFINLDFSHLHFTLGGGMAVQRPVAERWKIVTGKPLAQAYGLTETSPAVTINPLDLSEFNGSIGLPVPSTELSIRDDQGREMNTGEIGEICVKGPQVMKGYWNNPEETQKVFDRDGFLHTGDMGYIDADGFVYLIDRKKDIIIVSGFNVYPNEIEDVVATHPDVREVVAVGIDNGAAGEIVKIFVVRKNPSLTERQLIDFCRQSLTGYKVPKLVEFRDELPKTNVGKILRRALKNQ
ncbi:AMP-binding protein [Advenella sp. WQ 585]|uniref:Long-chain-fatty-acid--CoA ligase n=1 Tax=Advenella mandrilli TaxID=2800330 RepID=A0ABS1EDA9_9BURK|nr:AMP-binding protein [Advenella mandrilli]MBK1781010.1 AMP-binding protein [Advenella mandrilli]